MSVFDSKLWIRFGVEVQRVGRWEVPRPVRPVSAPASNPMLMAETTEELRKRPEIRKELERATGEERPEKVETHGRERLWFAIYVAVLVVCAAVYFLIGARIIPLPDAGISITQRILRGVALITVVLTVARAISFYVIGRIEDASTRFTLQRIARLAVALAVAVIVVSIIFVNWYTA